MKKSEVITLLKSGEYILTQSAGISSSFHICKKDFTSMKKISYSTGLKLKMVMKRYDNEKYTSIKSYADLPQDYK